MGLSLISILIPNIIPSWDIEGRELATVRRYTKEGQLRPFVDIPKRDSCDRS